MSVPTTDLSNEILFKNVEARIETLAKLIFERTNGIVQSGPFAGQKLLIDSFWGSSDLSCRLLGSYEAELHSPIEDAIVQQPDMVINVGCADGYYAIGLARRLPDSLVIAFDIDEDAQEACRRAAKANNVEDNMAVYGECTAELLKSMVQKAPNALVLLDCEGAEIDLLPEDTVATLSQATVLVECHDFLNKDITPTITQRLSATHDIEIVREGPRDPAGYSVLHDFNGFNRWMAVCEFRPEIMHWLIATPKTA